MEDKKTFTLFANSYEVPSVEVTEVAVESGFEGSTEGTGKDWEWG